MSADAKATAYFGAVPNRALSDGHLTDRDIRVLAVVSAHDNMSLLREGMGCFAGTDRLAELSGTHPSNVSSALTKLVNLGYLKREPHPIDGRRATFRVVFDTEADKAAFARETKRRSVKPSVSSSGKTHAAGVSFVSSEPGEMSRAEFEATPTKASTSDGKIERNPRNSFKKPSGEPAPTRNENAGGNVGAILAQLERHHRSGRLPRHEVETWCEYLQGVADNLPVDDPNRGRAERLHCELSP